MVNLVIWNEFVHEQEDEHVKSIYPNGIHGCIKEFLSNDTNLNIKTATLEEKEHGLTEELLDKTDVLIWWGHKAHNLVDDKIVDRVQQRILEGMGLIVLHSGHHSKIFKRMMGTTANLRWAERGEKERIWVCNPGHPIAKGLDEYFEIEMTEMYGEPFQVPAPDETIFVPLGAVHRIENPYKKPVKIIEAQVGSILKENDIVRFQDIYGRVK